MKKILLAAFLYSTNASAHTPPPIDVTNPSGNASHSGYGYYGNDDYEAFCKLRKHCTSKDLSGNLSLYKNQCEEKKIDVKIADQAEFESLSQKLVNSRFVDKILSNVVNEIQLVDPNYSIDPKSCFGEAIDTAQATHQDIRKEAMSLNNALSAALLADTHKSDDETSNYKDRLQINYPYLYNPKNRISDMTNLMKDALKSAYDSNPRRITSHQDTMSAMKAVLETNADVKNRMQDKLKDILTDYGAGLKKQVEDLCHEKEQVYTTVKDNPKTLSMLHQNFRRDFQQCLIDLPNQDRTMANTFLCKQPFYYDEKKFDSDCDGTPDRDDPSPNDPLAPNSSFHVEDDNASFNPPFGTTMKYDVKLEENIIKIVKPIKINFGDMSDAQITLAKTNLGHCTDQLAQSIKSSFDKLKGTPNGAMFKDKTINLDMKLEETKDNPDFKVHRCWCSTCDTRYTKTNGQVANIPKDTCKEDFTPEMKAGMADTKLNPSPRSQKWWPQDDAANFVASSLTNLNLCSTIKHEFMHKLGLPDEYHSESYYPFNQIGPKTSLMSGGDEVFDRHLVFLLSPKRCNRKSENYGL